MVQGKANRESQKAAKEAGGNIPASSAAKKPGVTQLPKAAGSVPSPKEAFSAQASRSSLNSLPQNPLSGKAIQIQGEKAAAAAPAAISARDFFLQTASVFGFPKDALSVAILAFARFFSLSLNPEQMGNLRREILATGKQSSPKTSKEKAALEAETLAALNALDKGVVLSPDALEHYAGFLSEPEGNLGPWPRWRVPVFEKDGEEEDSKSPDYDEVPAADKIQAIAEEQAKKDGLLDYLNVLPGKNGHFWIVYPFKIKVRGTVLKIFLRLLKREPSSKQEGDYIIADIAAPKRKWRFFLGRISEKLRAEIQVFPELPPKALEHLSKEAGLFMGKAAFGVGKSAIGNFEGFEEILVRNGGEVPSWVENLCDEHLLSINEEI